MTARELSICVMFDNLRNGNIDDPSPCGVSGKQMLDIVVDLWTLMGGEGEDLPVVVKTLQWRFYNPDARLELTDGDDGTEF